MNVIKNILGETMNVKCPRCGIPMTDVGYWWCKKCNYEISYRGLRMQNDSNEPNDY